MNANNQPLVSRNIYQRILIECVFTAIITYALALNLVAFSRNLSILSLFTPFIYYLYAINRYFLLEKLHRKAINGLEYILLAIAFAFFGSFVMFPFIVKAVGRFSDKFILVCVVYTVVFIPLTYYYFTKHLKSSRTIADLRKDLGKTTAEMKLMQSQINPHFLFNVMNSIYGIALQENAERTADSVQRLSQMMRFMLFENQQDYILLSRDLNYLREYVAIQSLRVEQVPSVKIESDIVDPIENFFISPMLLIPFVENAFKHGISMEEPSWIKVNAEIQDKQLKFSVYNSIHQQQGTDLERSKSGIGLENVKARLNSYYPGKHLLLIEQNQQEFFVFLTIDLLEGSNEEIETKEKEG